MTNPPFARDRAALLSLAILKVDLDREGRDYIDYFVPFAVEALSGMETDGTTDQDLQEAIRTSFGLTIPLGPLRQILTRAGRRGLVSRKDGRT